MTGKERLDELNNNYLQARKNLLEEMILKLTDEQRSFFYKLYPNGPTDKQLDWAIQQIDNTLKKRNETVAG